MSTPGVGRERPEFLIGVGRRTEHGHETDAHRERSAIVCHHTLAHPGGCRDAGGWGDDLGQVVIRNWGLSVGRGIEDLLSQCHDGRGFSLGGFGAGTSLGAAEQGVDGLGR